MTDMERLMKNYEDLEEQVARQGQIIDSLVELSNVLDKKCSGNTERILDIMDKLIDIRKRDVRVLQAFIGEEES